MKPTSTEDLKRLTGMSEAEKSEATAEEIPVETVQSARPIWTRPIPKLTVALLLLAPVFVVAGSLLLGRNHSASKPQTQNATLPRSPIEPAVETETLQRENARLKAKAALDGQAHIEKHLTKQPDKKPTTTSKPIPLAKERPAMSKAPTIAPAPVAIASTPPAIVKAPQPTPVALHSPMPSSRTRQAPDISPEQRWQQLAKLGSYGSIRPDTMTEPEFSTRAAQIPPNHRENSLQPAVQTTVKTASKQHEAHSDRISVPVLSAAEARILEAPLSESTASISAGTTAAGVLKTPIVLDEQSSTDRFTVQLSQPIKDSEGQTVLPANAQLLVQVTGFSQTGRVRLNAVAATWHQSGTTQEIPLPNNAIQIRGEDGQPLIANEMNDRSKRVAALNRRQFLLGLVRGVSGQLTQSNPQIQSGNGTTIITQDNRKPNLLAGALRDATDTTLTSIRERDRRLVESLESQPPVRYLEAGKAVQIFVNQSLPHLS